LNFIVIFLIAGTLAYAQVTTKIIGAKLSNAVISKMRHPCEGVAFGDACTNGVLYGGTNYAALGSSWKYMRIPMTSSGHSGELRSPSGALWATI
jgi:hypothetical protein